MMKQTSTEKKANKLAKNLLKALVDIEKFIFDPDMIYDSANIQLVSITGISESQKESIKKLLKEIF